ncbi:hypothetical protein [Arthrobacter sp. B2a2-09]|uniref:hypothetical protein n=1 Tax=Arthrobacter sp. B2a2-09 TaxID=2952822 RepID=UPI0022CD774D|nr:hypothetical protein [Arthrobacter sp. B2a2-09]MCZ9884485.1 hypothetical protein [Arthrobacter sp. B2a2-09]
MSTPALTSDRRSEVRRTIFVIDLLLLLAPPVHWLFSNGQSSVWYFLVANALVTLSLFALWKASGNEGEEAK